MTMQHDENIVARELYDMHRRNGWGLPMVRRDKHEWYEDEPPRMQFPPSFIWASVLGLVLWGLAGILLTKVMR